MVHLQADPAAGVVVFLRADPVQQEVASREENKRGAWMLCGYSCISARQNESSVLIERITEIRTATNFLRRSGGPSEDALHSSVTNVSDFRVSQTSHSPLKIDDKTLSLSIVVKKYTVVPWQRRLKADVDLTSRHGGFFELLQRVLMSLGSQFCNFGT